MYKLRCALMSVILVIMPLISNGLVITQIPQQIEPLPPIIVPNKMAVTTTNTTNSLPIIISATFTNLTKNNQSNNNNNVNINVNDKKMNELPTFKIDDGNLIDMVTRDDTIISLNNHTNLLGYNTTTTATTTTTGQPSMTILSSTSTINKLPQPIKLFNKADSRKRKIEKKSVIISPEIIEWKCPNISSNQKLECGCDMPHTLRCSGDIHSLEKIANGLRESPFSVSLLDCTLKNVTFLSNTRIFENVSLHGLVISSGEIKRVHRSAFLGMKTPLQALGLPNNALTSVPWNSLSPFGSLDRLDLSNNRIKTLGTTDFLSVPNLTYLELSENQISSISLRALQPLKKLITLKIGGNRLGDFSPSLQAIGQAINLKHLDLTSNSITGPLTKNTLPLFPSLELLNLNRNLLTSIQNGALENFPYLVTLSLRHNQIDVLQDHAFSGLSSLQSLDLGYNGIVAVSGASLQHLARLLVLDLTHNFLRALTSDLIAPLPSLKELRLDGNDISIVSKNALDGGSELRSLSILDNPLSCDCTLKSFAEWWSVSKFSSQDLLGAICATPPHLEGAPLFQIPIESLNCDSNTNNEYDNANVLKQLEIISKQSNLSYIKDFSNVITLKKLHLSADYGMILTWSVHLKNDEFTCDAIFVYKETDVHEILLDNSPIHCESYMMNDENIVSVILRDTSGLAIDECYRFCLVLLKEKNIKRDLVIGCSNITKLQRIETDNSNNVINGQFREVKQSIDGDIVVPESDIANFDKISIGSDEIAKSRNYLHSNSDKLLNNNDLLDSQLSFTTGNTKSRIISPPPAAAAAVLPTAITKDKEIKTQFELLGSLQRSFLPGLGLGILITSLFVLIWGATKLRNNQHQQATSNSNVTCYTATPAQLNGSNNHHHHHHHLHHNHETENRNRYLKLQATTSL